jgi:hypothetical protein
MSSILSSSDDVSHTQRKLFHFNFITTISLFSTFLLWNLRAIHLSCSSHTHIYASLSFWVNKVANKLSHQKYDFYDNLPTQQKTQVSWIKVGSHENLTRNSHIHKITFENSIEILKLNWWTFDTAPDTHYTLYWWIYHTYNYQKNRTPSSPTTQDSTSSNVCKWESETLLNGRRLSWINSMRLLSICRTQE